MISRQGVATDPTKIQAVENWPTPKITKQLRGFLGLTGYYRKFIRDYGMITRPLTELLKKNTPFQWTPRMDEAFKLLKQKMIAAPVLAVPDFYKPFVIEIDACEMGVGAILMQDEHPIAYLSKPLGPKNQALSVYEKECLAILLAVDRWRSYLQHQKFTIKTDHRSLQHLTEQRLTTKLQHKELIKLMDLQYVIQYKKGINNAAADAQSRCTEDTSVNAVSECIPTWIQRLQESYVEDPMAQQLLTELAISPDNSKGYTLKEGVIRHKGRVWVGSNNTA